MKAWRISWNERKMKVSESKDESGEMITEFNEVSKIYEARMGQISSVANPTL